MPVPAAAWLSLQPDERPMKLALTVICLLLPATLHAQPAAEADASPVMQARETFIGLSVVDLDASTRWYRDKLGLRVVMEFPRTEETRSRAAVLRGGGLTVELVQHDDAVPLRTILPRPGGSLYVHGIFKVGMTIDNFDEAVAALRARDVDIAFGPFPSREGQPANIMIRDDAGNYIQLFGIREGEAP